MKRSFWNLLFLISSFGLALMFLVQMGQELFPEWRGYQAQYYRRLAEVTGDRSKAATPLGVRQIYLPQMNRVDRCITCHTGIDNPKMAGQPQPFRVHPDLGISGFRAKHPFNEIGCTVCHQGQGMATTLKAAHGPVPHWEKPLLDKELVVGTCTTCHQNVDHLKGAQRLVQGMALFKEKGCIGCHMLHGNGMLIGPELSETWGKSVDQFDFRYVRGEKTIPNWIIEHFKDPQKVIPGYPALGISESPMPNYGLTDDEIRSLTALVLSFYSEEENDEWPIPARFKVAGAAPAPEPVYASKVEHGAAVFEKYGCVGCHGPQGRGGIKNENMDMSEVPPLTYVSDGYSKEEVKEIIREGRYPAKADRNGLSPPLWMPSWKGKLSDEEIDAVVEYLFSLNPEKPKPASSTS